MNEQKKLETQKQRGWSIVRNTTIAGVLAGIFFPIGIHIYCAFYTPRFTDLSCILLNVSQMPAIVVSQWFGLPLNNTSGNLAALPLTISVIITAVLFGLIGRSIGVLIKNWKSKR